MRLGPYAIIAPLGAGGMGEVYRARDTRLESRGRDQGAAAEVRPRSGSSARASSRKPTAAAALNHPNVVVVFDVGVDGDVPYVVSELLEGETLREALTRGPLPLRQRRSTSPCRSPPAWPPRTRRASSIAT